MVWESTPGCVNYGALYQKRYAVLHKACARLLAAPPADYADFLAKNAFWLPDYALFMALKDAHNGVCWQQWEEPLRRREPETLAAARAKYAADIDFWQAVQYLFYTQWHDLKAYANAQGIEIIGDLPFYGRGAGWQRQLHIFECPFYYIDYCLATAIALQFFVASLKDHKDAWQRYMKLTNLAGMATYTELAESAGMKAPFTKGSLTELSRAVADWIEQHQVS